MSYNPHSILIDWPASIDKKTLQDVLSFKNNIEEYYIKENIEVINTYCSILIIYEFTIDDVNDVFLQLKKIYNSEAEAPDIDAVVWNVPVCYDDEFGVDLNAFSKEINLSKSEIIKLHSEVVYTVYFIGFLPGFLYLGGLDSRLFLDRKKTPDLNVKKGAVAIGGQQTGVYPQDSPGGWHIIGNSPMTLFSANEQQPCLIKAGDQVKFRPVDLVEYADILQAVSDSNYQLKSSTSNA